MPLNLHHIPLLAALTTPYLPWADAPIAAQDPCPPEAEAEVTAGWRAYRADSIEAAEGRFAGADRRCALNLDAKVGLGYTALRRGALTRADSIFRRVIVGDSLNIDGWNGLALTLERRGDQPGATAAARRAVGINSRDETARGLLDRFSPGWERRPLSPVTRPSQLQVAARTRGSRFEVPRGRGWVPIYIKGINLGAALPGKFPSEFPQDSTLYARWISMMAGMNANVVRLYTILPPEFYRALRAWNLAHSTRPLWVIHGVWTELPPEHDFDDREWKESFRDEMRRVVHLVHGAIEIPRQPGHAGGRYDADVSRWTVAYIIGREWEPYAVKAYSESNPGVRSYRGRYLQALRAPATDVWMAEQSDFMLRYEVETFNAIRPIAYANWPTLDPLFHPSEATTEEEIAWRRKRGNPANLTLEYENDAIGLDPNLVTPTIANPAGWFASYHAYPYYPDFMLHDSLYNRARSREGRSNYFGYLRHLKRHHSAIPLVIAEYGVPSSRGLAHLQPQGWHHGGHDEREMARIDARLTREIRESGAAGGILFAWIDEWFKKNWIVIDLEIPLENTRLWHNMMDAEQNYGVIGMYAGRAESTPVLGGDPATWLAFSDVSGIGVHSDESYVYMALQFPGLRGQPFPWSTEGVMIALDTYLPRRGQHALPGNLLESEVGFEFLLDLRSPGDAELGIIPEYNPYGGPPGPDGDDAGKFYHRPITITDRSDGIFDSMYVGTNRARYGRDGTFYSARGYNRGRLRYGTNSASSLSDWYYDEAQGLIQVRIPWGLLNVSDPSTATLVFETRQEESIGTAKAEGFRIGLVRYRKSGEPRIAETRPRLDDGSWRAQSFQPWQWKTWETPDYHEGRKPAYDAMKEVWGGMQ